MDQLTHGSFPSALVWIGSVRDVAVEIFRNRDLGRERAPIFWNLDVLLFEDDLPAVVRDFSRPFLPLDLLEWRELRVAENALKPQPGILFRCTTFACSARVAAFVERGRLDSGFQLDHGRRREVEVVKACE